MRRNLKLGLNLALLAASLSAISGCNQGAGTEARTQGKGLAFKTAEPAPDGFDSWDFVWKGPKRALNSDLEELVLQPDGREYAKQEFAAYPGNSDSIHSSFSPGFAGGDPKVFWHQPIR